MIGIALFLLPRIFCVIYMAVGVRMFVKAKRRGRLEAWHYWLVGMSGYNIVAGWTSGMLYQCVEVLFWLCIAGYTVSLLLYAHKQQKARMAREAEHAAEVKAARHAAIDAEYEARAAEIRAIWEAATAEYTAQLDQERGEIVRALDLVESWQAMSDEELAVRQSETRGPLQAMETRFFDE